MNSAPLWPNVRKGPAFGCGSGERARSGGLKSTESWTPYPKIRKPKHENGLTTTDKPATPNKGICMTCNRHNLDQLMDSWARWVHQGGLVSGYGSIMEKLIDQKGVMNFGSGGKGGPVIDCVEARIEAALMTLATKSPKSVAVVRVHYGAIQLPGLSLDALRRDKAAKMGISLKTYETHLTKARNHLINTVRG
ncbi:hypothetical protein [Vibrio vulnificus]|uniref:hypothetical protein n=2 Tax=Vibrio vulnificus TaxID=672 RepID=UPI0011AED5C1|nr:hypothetical protein [Vibrio vulnificus]